jgi:hydroxymethylbilane synthase
MTALLRLGTRGSKLALTQAGLVRDALAKAVPTLAAPDAIEIVVLKTTGDVIQDRPLSEAGGKGLFVKEIEQALLDREADVAVHSMKDVPAELAPGLVLAAVSTREVPWDALCARAPVTVDTLPRGAKVGTSSMRRQCQLLSRRPDLQIAMLRGNVPTRIRKLDDGEFDAIVLAAAGLTRLGLGDRITQLLTLEISVPAVAQGVLGLETRADDARTAELIHAAIHDPAEERRVIAERAFLARMGGSCQTPLAAHAIDHRGGLRLVGLCGMPDGTKILRAEATGPADAAELLGQRVADDLLAQGADQILASTR